MSPSTGGNSRRTTKLKYPTEATTEIKADLAPVTQRVHILHHRSLYPTTFSFVSTMTAALMLLLRLAGFEGCLSPLKGGKSERLLLP